MADDRVFIKCKYCGGWKMLLKHFCGKGPKNRNNGIMDWLDTHAGCRPDIDMPNLAEPGFTLHTEMDLINNLLPIEFQNKKGQGTRAEG